MNGLLLAVAVIGAINPPRTRVALPEGSDDRARLLELVVGAIIALGVVALVAGTSGPLFEALAISPETYRIAAGLVVGIAGLRSLVGVQPRVEPELAGLGAAVWPIAFPRLVTPELVALVLATGSLEGVSATLAAAAGGLAILVALGAVRRRSVADGVFRWTGAVLGVVLVVVGAVLMIDGVRLV